MKPTKQEIVKLFNVIETNPELIKLTPDVGSLLGMKWVDSLLPQIKGTPEWDYEGLRDFCVEFGIESQDTIAEALAKLR